MLSNLETAERTALNLEEDIKKAFKNGTLLDQILNDAIEIQKDSGGKPTKIIYTVGGPYIYLDLFCDPGCIVVYFDSHKIEQRLSNEILKQIEFELEGLGYGN